VGVQCHQPGIDLSWTDAHSGIIVASLGDSYQSPIGIANDAAVAGGILEDGGEDCRLGAGGAQTREQFGNG
jgi:hypothetical protein